MYHCFASVYILNQHDICYLFISNKQCFDNLLFNSHNSLPMLYDFSQSLYLPILNKNMNKLYFSDKHYNNPYICIDLFVISYVLNNEFTVLDDIIIRSILDMFFKHREIFNNNEQ